MSVVGCQFVVGNKLGNSINHCQLPSADCILPSALPISFVIGIVLPAVAGASLHLLSAYRLPPAGFSLNRLNTPIAATTNTAISMAVSAPRKSTKITFTMFLPLASR